VAFGKAFVMTNWLNSETTTVTTAAEDVLGLSTFALEAVVTGSPTDCIVLLEGSVDGSDWLVSLTSFNIHSSPGGSAYSTVVNKPVRYIRLRIDTLSGGSSPTVTASVVGV
jgi:hypothetical protein